MKISPASLTVLDGTAEANAKQINAYAVMCGCCLLVFGFFSLARWMGVPDVAAMFAAIPFTVLLVNAWARLRRPTA